MTDDRLLSVVVIGRNEGERLRTCLHSIATMRRAGMAVEIIYVDSKSADHSVMLAKGLGVKTIELQEARTTAAMGRNAGWRAAHGSFILFLDGDTILDPAFVGKALDALTVAEVAVVWGHRREVNVQGSVYNRVLDLDWIYAAGDTSFCGGDALFRRSVLEEADGFDETLIAGEEPELCRRITARDLRIVHIDAAMTGHDLAITTFMQYWRRATRAGHAYAEVSERFRYTADPFWCDVAQANRTRATSLMMTAVISLAAAITLASVWPLLFGLAGVAGMTARSARNASWKTRDRGTLLLYAIHSHLQQIPIFFGQLEFFWHRWRGTRAGLVEYKRL